MLSQSVRRAGGLVNCRLPSACRLNAVHTSLPLRGTLARYQNTSSGFGDDDEPRSNCPSIFPRYGHRKPYSDREKVKSQKVQLDVSTLGQPGEVVLVREKVHRRRSSRTSKRIQGDTSELPHFLNELGKDTAPFDGSAVNEHIDGFRQRYQPQDKLAAGDFEDLRSRLRASFTTLQLSDYIKRNLKNGNNGSDGTSGHQGIATFPDWKPGTSDYLTTGPASREIIADRVGALQEIKGKDLLIERVLRDCWQLGITNETGQVDILIPPHNLSLLVGSELFSFEELASLYGVAIDVTNSLGHVRVTGKQRSCESVREIIHDYTNRIRSEELNLVPPGQAKARTLAQAFSPELLSWIERTYKIAIERQSSQLPSRIYVLAENQANLEHARRIMNLAFKKATSPAVPFTTYMSASELSDIRTVKLGYNAVWPDREKFWFRWEAPPVSNRLLSLPGFVENENHPILSNELLKVLRQELSMHTESSSRPIVRELITAALGRCYFLRNPLLQESRVSASQLGSMSLPRTFIKDVPQSTQLLRNLTLHAVEGDSRSHVIRLEPSALHASEFPPLELEVVITPNKTGKDQFDICSVKAILEESSVDHLLPESVVDIRFTRKLTHELLSGPFDPFTLKTLTSDLQNCFRKSTSSNDEVPLPTFTSVTLPTSVIRSKSQPSDPLTQATAEYMYLPVNDVQGTHVSQYNIHDTQLSYASYDSGPYNAHTVTDVYLQMESLDSTTEGNVASHSASSPHPSEEQFNRLYNAACAVASHLDLIQ